MKTREEYLKEKILAKGTLRNFATKIDMPYTTLFSILKNVGGASIDNILKICKGLNITIDHLNNTTSHPTTKEEKDIQKRLQSILDDLNDDAALNFYNGNQKMDEETKELLKISIENSIRTAKIRSK